MTRFISLAIAAVILASAAVVAACTGPNGLYMIG